MNFLITFELMCYIIVAIMLIYLIIKKDKSSIYIFITATIVGLIMELLAVTVTDIYEYNENFLILIGAPPKTFPLFGGFMWGGLTVYSIKIAKSFNLSKLKTGLISGFIIVTMDIFLDVIAIRLDGGFWKWLNTDLNYLINNTGFMSVIWVNFLGYMFEVPAVTILSIISEDKFNQNPSRKVLFKNFLVVFKNIILAILITASFSALSLLFDSFTNNYFSMIVFIILYILIFIIIVYNSIKDGREIRKLKGIDYSCLIFWLSIYIYIFISLLYLNISKYHLWFIIFYFISLSFIIFLIITKRTIIPPSGKTILVTGALGGMGLETCKKLINNGYSVVGIDYSDLNDNDLKCLTDNMRYFKADIRNSQRLIEIYEIIKDIKLYGICHFAGKYNMDSLIEISEDDIKEIFDINLLGVYRVNKIFLPLLEKNGKIIITSSELAPLDPLPFNGLYGITKSTLEKYAFSLRMELNLLNYKVSIIRPGAVKTKLIDHSNHAISEFVNNTKMYECNANRFQKIVNSVQTRDINPDKISEIVINILISKNPDYIYNINRNILLKLLNILPDRFQVLIIKMILKK